MRFFLLAALISHGISANSQIQLSEDATIAVVTLGPYQGEPWSAFGHNGFRVTDRKNKIDWFYDYGVYDFNQENFFLNFAKGLLKYKVSVRRWDRSYHYQKNLNRYIKLQYLNLNAEENQHLFDFLQNNSRPENAEYLYHYVYDNCATKIRDVISEEFPHRVEYDLSYLQDGRTFRGLMDDYLGQQEWADLGIDIGLGMEVDREAKAHEYMFLPPYIFKALEGATIRRDSITVPLVSKTVNAFIPTRESEFSVYVTPQQFFIILFFITGLITHRNLKTGRRTKWIDQFLFGFAGFVGLWVIFLWVGTEHMSKSNLNILWAFPLHIPVVLLFWKKRWIGFFKMYFLIMGIWYSIMLIVWAVLPQPLHSSLVPLVLTLLLRCFYIYYDLRTAK